MKRLALLIPALLLLAACNISSAPWINSSTGATFHWKRTESEVVLNVVLDPSANSIKPLVGTAIYRWNKAAYVAVRWAPYNRCATGASCIIVKGAAINGGWGGFTYYGDSHIARGMMTVDNRTPIDSQRMNAVCHEMGHTLGLGHGSGQGPCINGYPTAWDYAVVKSIHEHRHAT